MREALEGASRFEWPKGGLESFNCKGGLTISDIGGAISWLWTYIPDFVLRAQPINQFFELSPLHTGGSASSALGVLLFFAAIPIVTVFWILVVAPAWDWLLSLFGR